MGIVKWVGHLQKEGKEGRRPGRSLWAASLPLCECWLETPLGGRNDVALSMP